MAEKVLQANLGVAKPAWLPQDYYDENVLGVHEAAAAASARCNSDFAYVFEPPRASAADP